MQSNPRDIYKMTAARTGKSHDVYKDIGNFVFAKTAAEIRKPKALIIKLKGVGSWYIRRLRMDVMVKNYPPDQTKTREDYTNEAQFQENEHKKELHELFKERLKDYEKYIEIRNATRTIRHKTQVLLQPPPEED